MSTDSPTQVIVSSNQTRRVLRDLDHQLNKYAFTSLDESGPRIMDVLESSGYVDSFGLIEDLKIALESRDRRLFEGILQDLYLVIRGDHPYLVES